MAIKPTALLNLRSNIKNFNRNFPDLVMESLQASEDFIIQLNQDRLYDKGTDIEERPIATNRAIEESDGRNAYAQKTIFIKERKGQPTDRVTLFDDGEFYDSFYVEFENDYAIIMADLDKLEEIYQNIDTAFIVLGLSDEDKVKLRDYIKPDVMNRVREYLLSGAI